MNRIKKYLLDLFQDLKSVKKSGSFIQNLAFVSSSKFLIAIGGFLFTPILSRIYDQEAYGTFAIFNAYVTIVATFSTLRLPIAFVLPKEEKEFDGLLKASVMAVLITAIICVPVFSLNIFNFEDLKDLGFLKHFIFMGVLFTSINFIMSNWIVRVKKFKSSSTIGVGVNYSTKIFNVIYGFFTKGHWSGIILTNLLAMTTALFTNFYILKEQIRKIKWDIKFSDILTSVKKYKNYPLYVLPTSWIGTMIAHIPIIYLGREFGEAQLGIMSFAVGLLDLPIRLIGENAIGKVLLQKTAELKNRAIDGKLMALFNKAYLTLALVSIPGFTIVILFGEELFEFVFSEEWKESGKLAGILSISYMVRLINTPTSSIMRILELEKLLFVQLGFRVTVVLVGIYTAIHLNSFVSYVWIWSIGQSLIFVFFMVYLYRTLLKLSKKSNG